MKQKGKRTLTPKLRFPEFRDDDGWQTPQLSDLYGFKRTNTLSRDKLNYEAGTVRNIHYGDIHTEFKPLFRVDQEYVPFINPKVSIDGFKDEDDCEEGDIVLADASEDLNDVGKAIEVVSLVGQRVVAGTHTILATRHGSIPIIGFGGHLFQSAAVRAGIQRESQGAKIYGISANRISSVALPIPPTHQEQKKIAECLSSLDRLIAAQGRMLEALKAHKKGLMQQLFPQPGQTQPRLRFSEFGDKGDWEEKMLSVIAENLDNKRVPITKGDRIEGDVPYYGASGIVDYVRDYLFDEDLLCVSEDGANLVARTYPIAFPISGKTWVNNHSHVLRFDKLETRKMVEDYLNSIALRDFITGMAQPKLNRTMLDTIPIPLPEQDEQQRIAGCLTALDTRIAAQAAKIESLKIHKRGLMQPALRTAVGRQSVKRARGRRIDEGDSSTFLRRPP